MMEKEGEADAASCICLRLELAVSQRRIRFTWGTEILECSLRMGGDGLAVEFRLHSHIFKGNAWLL